MSDSWSVRAACRSLLLTLLLATSLTLAASSQAEPSIALGTSGVTRTVERAADDKPFWINRSDCETANDFQFPFKFTETSGLVLQVWVASTGVDCKVLSARAADGGCRKLPNNDDASLEASQTVTLSAQDVIAAGLNIVDRTTLCSTAQTLTPPRPLVIYFLLLRGEAIGANYAYEQTQVDLLGPVAPTNVTAGIGEAQLIVKWPADSSTDDAVVDYQLFCDPLDPSSDPSSCASAALTPGGIPNPALRCGELTAASAGDATISNLQNGSRYAIGVAGVDAAGNVGVLSGITCASPEAVTDFYETYRQAGGKAGGGACTFAPDGSVKGAGLVGCILLLGLTLRRWRRSPRATWSSRIGAVTFLLALFGESRPALASGSGAHTRGRAAFGADGGVASVTPLISLGTGALYELRFGPYQPKIDEEFSGVGPYQQMFRDRTRLLVGLEGDWQALRIDGIGTLGPGFGAGTTEISAKAPLASGSGTSSQETTLSIVPLYGVAVLRLTVLDSQLGVPLVPYAKAGLGYALWSITSADKVARADGVKGSGASYGTQWSAGLMLNLGFFDPAGEADLRAGPGFENAYVFGEWLSSNLDGFGTKKLQVGADTWFVGLALRD